MREPAGARSPADGLWEFSLAFYARPGVARALLALQDRDGRDVNLILYALWLGCAGRGRLDPAGLALADGAVRGLRRRLIMPLRGARRRLKSDPDHDVQALRERLKELELAAEKLAQSRLAALAGPAAAGVSRSERLAAAADNLALYLGTEKQPDEARRLIGALAGFAA